MSAARKTLFPAALMLALIMGNAARATGQGLWTYQAQDTNTNVTISILNLTTQRLVVTSNDFGTSAETGITFNIYCNIGKMKSLLDECRKAQSRPFQRMSNTPAGCPGTLCIDPYRTATWAGGDIYHNGDWAWDGRFTVEYENPASPWSLWTIVVNASLQNPADCFACYHIGKGSWWYMYSVNHSSNGCELWPGADTYSSEGIYVTPILPGPMVGANRSSTYATRKFSVMTMSGNDCGGQLAGALTASLFAGANNHMVLVLREHLAGDNYIGWKLDFVDQPNTSVPGPPGCNGCWYGDLK